MVLVSKNLFSLADTLHLTLVYTMLDTLMQSKTRLKLLLSFFFNPDISTHLRGLALEFDESTNAIRVEMNRFEEVGLIQSHKEGNKRCIR
jgi:predicted transcriptional regulator